MKAKKEDSKPYRQRLKLGQITKDPSFQVRNKQSEPTIKRYAELLRAGFSFPPISVAHVDGMFILTDGWHRIAAHQREGREVVDAEVFVCSREEAIWMAAKANMANGLQLKNSEIRNVFGAYIRAHQHIKSNGQLKSYREIQAAIGKGHTTIRNWMRKDFPRVYAQMSVSDPDEDDELEEEDFGTGDGIHLEQASQLIQQLQDTFQSSADPEFRGTVIARIKAALGDMEASGNWQPPPEDDF